MAGSSRYSPLTNDRTEIRLLHVDTSPLGRHTLISGIVFRQQQTRFVALSYPWGQGGHSKQVIVNDENWEVTQNLAEAIEEVIAFWKVTYPLRNRELYLWVDRLCINQDDKSEKSHQVGLMRDIYQQAEEVLVWLPLPTDFRNSFHEWKDWHVWHRERITTTARYSSKRPDMVYAKGLVAISGDYPTPSTNEQHSRDVLVAWSNVHCILASSWWERAWVYQEFMGPDRATFLFQGLWAPWQDMHRLITLFFDHREDHARFCVSNNNAVKGREHRSVQYRTNPGCCCSCLNGCQNCMEDCAHFGLNPQSDPDWYDVCCVCFKASNLGHNVLRQRDVMNDKNLQTAQQQKAFLHACMEQHLKGDGNWQMVNFVLKHKADWVGAGGSCQYEPLSELLTHGRNCKSTEVKDKVYAFLGLASPAYNIKPDYDLSDNAVFIEATKAIIEQEMSLDVLAMARENTRPTPASDLLPSWVPDWSDRENLNSGYREFLTDIRFPINDCCASLNRKPVVFVEGRVLHAKGVCIDHLVRVTKDVPHASYRNFQTQAGREVSTVTRARAGDEIWILLGAREVFTMRREGATRIILGHAMLYEVDGGVSPIMTGAVLDQVDRGKHTLSDIAIV